MTTSLKALVARLGGNIISPMRSPSLVIIGEPSFCRLASQPATLSIGYSTDVCPTACDHEKVFALTPAGLDDERMYGVSYAV